MMRRFVYFLILSSLLTGSAAARDIYVSNVGGNELFKGLTMQSSSNRSGPVRTIGRALELAHTGDRIVLAETGQPYRESISLVGSRNSGYSDRPLVILGNGGILDGSAPVPVDAWKNYRKNVFRFRPPRMGQQQLFIDDRPVDRVAVDPNAQKPPKLEPLQWCLLGSEIYFCVEPDKLPRSYNLTHSRLQTGITLFHVRHVAIVNLTVQGFQVDGISAHNSARDVYVSGVTCRGNGRAGIHVGGASNVEINGCLFGNNGRAQLLTSAHSQTDIANSELLSNTAPAWVDRGGRVTINGQEADGGIDTEDVQPAPAP